MKSRPLRNSHPFHGRGGHVGTARPFLSVGGTGVLRFCVAGILWIACGAAGQTDDPPADAPQERAEIMILPVLNEVDVMLFGGESREQVRQQFEAQLAQQLDEVERVCGLSEKQRRKLQLAGRGDVRDYFERVDEFEQRLRESQKNGGAVPVPEHPWQLRLSRNTVFAEESLWRKTLRNTLDAGQRERFERNEAERREFRNRAVVAEMVAAGLEAELPLRRQQRERLIALILEQIPPGETLRTEDGPRVREIILQQADELRPLFSAEEFQTLRMFAGREVEPVPQPFAVPPPAMPGAAR